MSIGQLGSSGEQFRDFLGSGQRDIGRGLQAVLSSYSNPEGNFVRLDNRSQGMFQLTNSEYQSVFDQDAQNSFAETWYSEYRAVLQLRAEALKKKLNRAYTKVLENSIYAPLRPNEEWAPGANRDFNDIDADSATKLFADGSGGSVGIDGAPVIPSGTLDEPPEEYMHPDWFSGADPLSTGEPYDDIRRYMAQNFLNESGGNYFFDDIDQDGESYYFSDPDPNNTNDGTYQLQVRSGPPESENITKTQYFNLWNAGGVGPTANTAYSLSSLSYNSATSSYSNDRYQEIAKEMNVPPSTDTSNFVAEGNKPSGASTSNTYFIQIPPGLDSTDVYTFLPSFAQGSSGVFNATQKATAEANGVPSGSFVPAPSPAPAGTFVLAAGTTFYDPAGAVSQKMFLQNSFSAPGNASTSPTAIMNPALVGPDTAGTPAKTFQDMEGNPSNPAYEQGFIDSWLEARQLEKREAAVEAAYQAYVDGKAISDASPNPLSYEEIMDVVFSSLDTYDVDLANVPGATPLPSGATMSENTINGVMPYGYYAPTAGGSGHAAVNNVYDVGGAYKGPGNNSGNSIYQTIYDNVAATADPSALDAGGAGSGAISNNPVPASGADTPPVTSPAPAPDDYNTLGGSSNLYTPIPIGAAENQANTGQFDADEDGGTDNLNTTLNQVPGFITGVDDVSKLFVGRQWDYVPGHVPNSGQNTQDGVGAVRYAAETQSTHVHAGIGWYDADGTHVGTMPVTMTPPIDGFAIQTAASLIAVGFTDTLSNMALGGPFFQVAGGEDSVGLGPDIGGPTEYSFSPSGIQIGGGVGGIFWGHTSAVGKIYRIERLLEHSGGGDDGATSNDGIDDLGGKSNDTDFAFGSLKATLAGFGSLGGLDAYSSDPNDGMSVFPNVGIVGGHVDGNLPIPIPIPGGGLYWLNLPLTSYFSTSYDLVTDYLNQYLEAMKHEVLDSVSAYSYATGGGYAMDSYGMRGEYHFTEQPALEALEKIPDIFGVSLDGIIGSVIGMIGLKNYSNVNGYDIKEDGILGKVDDQTAFRSSFTAPEQRELDTGAFFTTASFLSQFQLNDLEYSYWTSTHQNEEMANLDTLRMLSLTGRDLLSALSRFIFGMAGRLEPDGPAAAVVVSVMNFMLDGFEAQLNEAVMWDILMRDQYDKGGVVKESINPAIRSVTRRTSSLTSEGYDFIEDERKLFAYDYEEVRKQGILGKLKALGQGSFEIPNQVMAGVANTRRYKPYLTGPDGRAGRQGYGTNSPNTVDPGTYIPGTGRVHEITRRAGDESYYDDNWDIRVGFWQDTGLGDVNEVYVRKNTVKYNNTVNNGIGSGYSSDPVVTTEIDRYVGSHNRIIGRGYDGSNPLDLQSFRTGYFSEKYFGQYIDEINFTSNTSNDGDPTGVRDDQITYGLLGGIDGDPNRSGTITMHGGTKYYDRKNDYEFKMTSVDGTAVNLTSDQALAPVLGGAMKLMSLENNNPNQVLGATTQNESNALTAVLYDHMRIRADGSNAQLVAEYRDAFNMGYLDDIFITASADAATGGGVSSSIRIKFGNQSWTNASGTPVTAQLGSYESARNNEIVGTGTLSTVPGYLGDRSFFKNVNRSVTDIYLSSYFAFKRPPNTEAK